MARNGTLGARAAVYRGAAVLVGAEDGGAARTGSQEKGRKEKERRRI